MTADPHAQGRDSERRIRDLEAEVRQLTSLVETLRLGIPGETESDRAVDERVRILLGQWLGWGVALICMLAAGAAGVWTLNEQNLPMWQRLAFGYGLSVTALLAAIGLRRVRKGVASGLLAAGLAAAALTTVAGLGAPEAAYPIAPFVSVGIVFAVSVGCLIWAGLLRDHAAVAVLLAVLGLGGAWELYLGATTVTLFDAVSLAVLCAVAGCGARIAWGWRASFWSAVASVAILAIAMGAQTAGSIPDSFVPIALGSFAAAKLTILAGLLWADRRGRLAPWESFLLLSGILGLWVLLILDPRDSISAGPGVYFALGGVYLAAMIVDWMMAGDRSRLSGPFLALAGLWLATGCVLHAPERSWPWFVVALSPLAGAVGYALLRQGVLVAAGFGGSLFSLYAVLVGEVNAREVMLIDYSFALTELFLGVSLMSLIMGAFVFERLRRVGEPPSVPSLLYAALASLIAMLASLWVFREDPGLPFLLAGLGLLLGIAGVIAGIPALEAGAFFVLAAAHVAFSILAFSNSRATFSAQPNLYTHVAVFATVTLVVSILWERYLRRSLYPGTFLYGLLCALPGLAALSPWIWLLTQFDYVLPVCVSLACTAGGLMMVGRLTSFHVFRHASLACLGIACALLMRRVYTPPAGLEVWPAGAFELASVLLSAILVERFLRDSDRVAMPRLIGWDTARWLIVSLIGALGVLTIYEWTPESRVVTAWIGLSVGLLLLGFVFRDARYRIVSFFIYLGPVVAHVFFVDFAQLEPITRFLAGAGLLVPAALTAWGYAEWAARHRDRILAEHDARAALVRGEEHNP